jgi:transcriptional regulator with XRE-family HTH domain
LAVFSMNIGETIRNYRLGKGMSQGDIEKRTGLLRCYLSRVENCRRDGVAAIAILLGVGTQQRIEGSPPVI